MEIMDQAAKLRKLAVGRGRRGSAALLEPGEEEALPVEEQTPAHAEGSSPPVRTRVISVTSGKGGVGKTCFSVNLAICMARLGKRVILFDGDLGLANVNVLLGIIPEHNIYEVMKGKKRLKDVVLKTSYGIDILAGANGISQLANLSEQQRNGFIKELETLEGYDVMLIDTGAGVGANVIGLVLQADDVVVVTTPEPTAITDAYGMIKSIVANNQSKRIRLVTNRVGSAVEAKRVADRLISISDQFLRTKVENLGFIFEEALVQKSVRSQRPHVALHANSKSAACIQHIAARLLNTEVVTQDEGIGGFFRRFLGFLPGDG